MQSSVLVDTGILVGLSEAAVEYGIDLEPRLLEAGLDVGMLERVQRFFSWAQFNRLLESIAGRDGYHAFGLTVGKYQTVGSLGVAGQLIMLYPDVRTALREGLRYGAAFTQASTLQATLEDGLLKLTRIATSPEAETFGQLSSLGLAKIHKMLPKLCGSDWQPTAVTFSHTAPPQPERSKYAQFFQAPVTFGSGSDSIYFAERFLDRKIPTANSTLLAAVESHAKNLEQQHNLAVDTTTRVRVAIRGMLGYSPCSLERVAAVLNLHPKKLYRELVAAGVSFRRLLVEERFSLACHFLSRTDMPLAMLAELLGYSNTTALSRAFANRCGEYPSAWRLRKTSKSRS